MRILFLGSGPIAERCLSIFFDEFKDDHSLVGLVTSCEMLNIFSGRFFLDDVTSLAIDPVDRREMDLVAMIDKSDPDILISVQYPWILSGNILGKLKGCVANLHNAKLPDYRGHYAISHEILNGERTHTATLHWMAEEVDRGLEIDTVSVSIFDNDTAYSLWLRSVSACVMLFRRFLLNTKNTFPEITGKVISNGGRFYSRKSINEAKKIPDDASLSDIDRISRAFWFPPYEPAFFMCGGRKLYVLPEKYQYIISNDQ